MERFLQQHLLESQHERIVSTLDLLADHPCSFSLADVSYWLELDSDREAVIQELRTDRRFIEIGEEACGSTWYVPVETLFRWWIGLTLRLASAGQFRLSGRHLAAVMSSLRTDSKWEEPPRNVISLGEHFCLVRGPDEDGYYHFPMAKRLSHFHPTSYDQVKKILTEFCSAVKRALPFDASPSSQRSSAISDFLAKCSSCVVLSEIARRIEAGTDVNSLVKSLETDRKIVRIGRTADSEVDNFVGADTLFWWWSLLTLKLAKAGQRRLPEHELLAEMNSLRVEGEWKSPPFEVINYGKSYGFVSGPHASGLYSFPIAGCLSKLSNTSLAHAQEVLLDLLNTAGQPICSSQEPDDASRDRLARVVSDVFITLTPKERRVLLLRFGVEDGRRHTLEEIGREYALSRERIRQIQKKAFAKLRHPTRLSKILRSFLVSLITSRGSLLCDVRDPETPSRLLVAECLGIPFVKLSELGIILLGVSPDELGSRGDEEDLAYTADKESIASRYGAYLSDTDLAVLTRAAEDRARPPHLGKAQKVRAAMQQIGVPAHYSEIAEVFNTLYPDKRMSERNVHAILSREPLDIVWIGVRGTYALKAWGYERPPKALFENVAEIVERRFAETGKPVPFQVIAAEIGKYRQVVRQSSLTIAAACNPKIRRVGKDNYVPRIPRQEDEEDDWADELDEVLRRFEVRTRKRQDTPPEDHSVKTGTRPELLLASPATAESKHTPTERSAAGRKRHVLDESAVDEWPPQLFFGLAAWARREKKLSPWQRHFIFDIGRYRAFSRQLSVSQKRWVLRILDDALEAGLSLERDVDIAQTEPVASPRNGQLAFQIPLGSSDEVSQSARSLSDDSNLVSE